MVDPLTGRALVTSEPTGEVVQRSSLLPIGRDASGRLVPAVPGFIADAPQAIASAVTLPRDAWRGDVETMPSRMSRQEGERVADLAGLAMTGSLPFKAPKGALRSFGGAAEQSADDIFGSLEAGLAAATKDMVPEVTPRSFVDPAAKSWDLYHGTASPVDFARFRTDLPQEMRPNTVGSNQGQAVFFSPSADEASHYALGRRATGQGVEAGPRTIPVTVDPGKTGVLDMVELAQQPDFADRVYAAAVASHGNPTDPSQLRSIRNVVDLVHKGQLDQIASAKAFNEQYGHLGVSEMPTYNYMGGGTDVAVQMAREQGLDTAIIRGLHESNGGDQVITLTPGRVRSRLSGDLLYSGGPSGAAVGAAALSAPSDAQASPFPSQGAARMAAAPFSFGRPNFGGPSDEEMARALAMAQSGMATGFSGSPTMGLPQQPAPMSARPFSFGQMPAPLDAMAQASPMAPDPRMVPLPPMRPGADELTAAAQRGPSGGGVRVGSVSAREQQQGSGPSTLAVRPVASDMPAQGAHPIMAQGAGVPQAGAAAAGEGPGLFERVLSGLGRPGVTNLLSGISQGLLTQPNFAQGIGVGLAQAQKLDATSAATRLADAEYGLKARKLVQEQQGVNQTKALLRSRGYSDADADGIMASYAAGNATALNAAMSNAFPKNPEAPSGYRLDLATGRASFIPGGPQDPATIAQAKAAEASAKSPDDFSLSPGQTRYSGSGQPIASARSDKPEHFDTESKLRAEFSKGLGSFADVHDGYGRVIAATQEREKNPAAISPASDMSLVFGFMKMLDPTSVVREGEYATAKNAAGIPDQFRNAYNKAIDGEFLNPQQRQDFVNQSAALYGKARSNADALAERYRGLAGQYGVDPERSVYLPAMPTAPQVSGGRARAQGDALGVGNSRDMGDGITVRRVR
ncbi:hypothetical protein [Methylobacterium sp. Leaf456]|uniref:hypothetical protein n=1 Tax=Methylobacterium sp. Leaf456 TaxID=1736382 RepID=UPI0012E38400|nr:hypothetical protein [Methylobacterium sp. Leaf456]